MKKKISTLFICAATLAGVAVSTGAVNAEGTTGSTTPATTATTPAATATTAPETEGAAKASVVTIHYYNKSSGAEISGQSQTVTSALGSTADVKLQVPAGFKYGKDNDTLKVEFNLAQKSVDVYVTPDSADASTSVSADDNAATNASATNAAASATSDDAALPATGSKAFVNVALAASGVIAVIAAAGYAIVSRIKAHKAK